MTVKEFRRFLEGKPDDTPVFVSSDEEGNDFNPLYDAELAWMDVSTREYWHPDDVRSIDGLTEVVVLWP